MALCESWLDYKIHYNFHTLMLSQPVSKNVYMPHVPPWGVCATGLETPHLLSYIHHPFEISVFIWN